MLPLRQDLQERWEHYLKQERDGLRKEALRELDEFVDQLLMTEPAAWHGWAKRLTAEVADKGSSIPVRFPLFRKVLLPALIHGMKNHERGCARWLAHFDTLLYHFPSPQLPEGLRTPEELLREAVRQDPGDRIALVKLIHLQANYLDYTLHELPSGVLYGHNSATVEQCTELLDFLGEFKSNVQRCQEQEKYAELIEECTFHYNAYRDYLSTKETGKSYRAYLQGILPGAETQLE